MEESDDEPRKRQRRRRRTEDSILGSFRDVASTKTKTGYRGGDWCQTRPMGLTKGGLPPFSRLPGTLVRLPVEVRSKTALIL